MVLIPHQWLHLLLALNTSTHESAQAPFFFLFCWGGGVPVWFLLNGGASFL